MKQFYLNKNKTVICTMIGHDNIEATIIEGRHAEAGGTHALTIGIERLRPEFRNQESLKTMIDAFVTPVMVHYYRPDKWRETPADDEERARVLVEAAKAGAGMIDIIGDQFDPSKDERTFNAAAIEKQKALIAEIHALGAQVIMSSHPMRPMSQAEVTDQLRDFESRGADVVKIVTQTDTEEQFCEAIKTTIALNHELNVPFVFLSCGRFGYAHRIAGLSLGVAASFTVIGYDGWRSPVSPNPLVRNMRAVQDNTIWHL